MKVDLSGHPGWVRWVAKLTPDDASVLLIGLIFSVIVAVTSAIIVTLIIFT